MERFGSGWDQAVEQPSFLALLPEPSGRRVLDLGCGAGQLAFHKERASTAGSSRACGGTTAPWRRS